MSRRGTERPYPAALRPPLLTRKTPPQRMAATGLAHEWLQRPPFELMIQFLASRRYVQPRRHLLEDKILGTHLNQFLKSYQNVPFGIYVTINIQLKYPLVLQFPRETSPDFARR